MAFSFASFGVTYHPKRPRCSKMYMAVQTCTRRFAAARTISDDGLAYKRSRAQGMRPCDSTTAGTVDGDGSMSHQDRNKRADARTLKENSRYGGACARKTKTHA